MKKGDLHFDTIGRLVIAIVIIVILITIILAFRDKITELIKNIFGL